MPFYVTRIMPDGGPYAIGSVVDADDPLTAAHEILEAWRCPRRAHFETGYNAREHHIYEIDVRLMRPDEVELAARHSPDVRKRLGRSSVVDIESGERD